MTQRLPRIRLDSTHDEDLIRWLAELENLPFGTKGKIVKQTLRRGLGGSQNKIPTGEVFDTQELLADIRRVVEASLEESLSRLSITPLSEVPKTLNPMPDEVDTILNNFGASLMMLDEEEDDA